MKNTIVILTVMSSRQTKHKELSKATEKLMTDLTTNGIKN